MPKRRMDRQFRLANREVDVEQARSIAAGRGELARLDAQLEQYRLEYGVYPSSVTVQADEPAGPPRPPSQSQRRLALDLTDVLHFRGDDPNLFFAQWSSIFYRGAAAKVSHESRMKGWERWKKLVRAARLAYPGPGRTSSSDPTPLVLHLPRVRAWIDGVLGRAGVGDAGDAENPYRYGSRANPSTRDEILAGVGEMPLEDWRSRLPFTDPVEHAVIVKVFGHDESPKTVREIADEVGKLYGKSGKALRDLVTPVRAAVQRLREGVSPLLELAGVRTISVGRGKKINAMVFRPTGMGMEAAIVDPILRGEAFAESRDAGSDYERMAAQHDAAALARQQRMAVAAGVRPRGAPRQKRGRTMVLPHAGLRACRLCNITHTLAAHRSHRGPAAQAAGRVRVDMLGMPLPTVPAMTDAATRAVAPLALAAGGEFVGPPRAPIRDEFPVDPDDTSFDFGANVNPGCGCGRNPCGCRHNPSLAVVGLLNPPSSRCLAGQHDYDPRTRACKRRGCRVVAPEPGQGWLLGAPPILPTVQEQRGLFGGEPPPLPPPADPHQRGLFGGNPPSWILPAAIGAGAAYATPAAYAALKAAGPAWLAPAAVGAGVGGLVGGVAGYGAGKASSMWRGVSDAVGLARDVGSAGRQALGAWRGNPRQDSLVTLVGSNPTERSKRGQRHLKGHVTLESARSYAQSIGRAADFDRALRAFRQFHGVAPTSVALFRVPVKSGQGSVEFGAALGPVTKTMYGGQFVEGSNKNSADVWVHDHPKGGQPLEVLLPRTGLTTKVGGTYRVTKWWYD